MKAPKAKVASVLMPWIAPPKTPCAQLPALPVRPSLAESIRPGSISSLCSVSLIQSTAAWTWVSIVDHWSTTPTVMSASRPNAPTTMSTVMMSAPQVRPRWCRSSQSTAGMNVAPSNTANRVGTTRAASRWSAYARPVRTMTMPMRYQLATPARLNHAGIRP